MIAGPLRARRASRTGYCGGVRDYAQVRGDGRISIDMVDVALRLEGIDELGLDEMDRKYLSVIGSVYQGGPVGLEAVAATLGEDAGTLEDMVEPYLLQIGFLARTRRRAATDGRRGGTSEDHAAAGGRWGAFRRSAA